MEAHPVFGRLIDTVETDVATVRLYEKTLSHKPLRRLATIDIELRRPIKPMEAIEVKKVVRQLVDKHLFNRGDVYILAISGRMPVWGYAIIIHEVLHVTPAVATYDPKLGGIVIVATHTPVYEEGQVVRLGGEQR